MGGVAGHLSHVHEDLDLTFGEIKSLLSDVASAKIEAVEKFDGQNIFFKFFVDPESGELKTARNVGDVFDPKWWARRVAWMMRLGMSTNHPVVADVFPEINHCTLIEYSFPKFDLCWFDENIMLTAIKIVTDKSIKQSDIDVAERALDRKGHNPKKYLLSFFEPDPKINTSDWEVIPMVDFSHTFHDMSDALDENLDMTRSLDDCGSWMLLLDEFTTRYLSYYNNNDANNTAMMRYFAEQLGISKTLDKVAKQGTGLF